VEDVREHVLHTFNALGKDGGLIFSTHDIPLGTSRENVEVMVETIERCTY
jgi:uroporphyrinogen-III decarboxylase